MTTEIKQRIYILRGHRVMIDRDLAILYGVETKVLNQAVRRNITRFPSDFMVQLTDIEGEFLRSQFVTSKTEKRGGRRYRPLAFTEHGIAMLSSVLNSERAIQVNIGIIRTFIRLRRGMKSNPELVEKLNRLEKKYDQQFEVIFDAIDEITAPTLPSKRNKIGFAQQE